MEDWNFQTRSVFCSQCQKVFEDQEICFTILNKLSFGYERRDLCEMCWESIGKKFVLETVGVFSHWRGVYELPPAEPVDPLPKEDAESILRRMLERNHPKEVKVRYILAVMLERKKILRHRETQRHGDTILVYEHSQTGEVLMIPDPQIHLNEIQEVQKQVAAMLKMESTTERKEIAVILDQK